MDEDEIVEGSVVEEELSGEDLLFNAIQQLKAEEAGDDEESDDLGTDEELDNADEEIDEEEIEEADDEELDPESDEAKGKKREQSKEENARFAAQRRQEKIDQEVELKLAALRDESPEFKLAKQMAEMYGVEPSELIEQMAEAALQKEATAKNLPVELLRERSQERAQLNSVQEELNALRYENWQTKIKAEGETLKSSYAMLTQEDMDAAVDYILHEAKNVNMLLKQAVYALHGEKIIDGLANSKSQEKLAAESGRKRSTPVAPKNGKAPSVSTLSADEKYVAKQMGLSESEYLKYK